MKKHIFIALLTVSLTSQLFAGSFSPNDSVPSTMNLEMSSKAVVKMNLSSLALLNFSFQGEYAFARNFSACLGYYRLLPLSIPKGIGVDNFIQGDFNGFGITPEIRIYPGKKEKPAPNGFYIAPYFRYTKYTLNGSYTDPDNSFSGSLRGVSKTYAPGLMLGSQWILGKHFSIDLFIIGFHGGKRSYQFDVQNSNIPGYTSTDKQEIVNGALYLLDRFGNISANIEDDRLSVKFATGHWGFRGAGLNLGFAF